MYIAVHLNLLLGSLPQTVEYICPFLGPKYNLAVIMSGYFHIPRVLFTYVILDQSERRQGIERAMRGD